MIELDEIVQEFLVESHENLDQLDSDLLALEQEPGSRALLGSIFRTIHTIKGTSGFLAYGHLEAVTHVGENLLSRLRDGELVADAGHDQRAARDGRRRPRAARLHRGDRRRGRPRPRRADRPADRAAVAPRRRRRAAGRRRADAVPPVARAAPARSRADEPALPRLGEVLVEAGAVAPEAVLPAVLDQALGGDTRQLGEILVGKGAVEQADARRRPRGAGATERGAASPTAASASTSTCSTSS